MFKLNIPWPPKISIHPKSRVLVMDLPFSELKLIIGAVEVQVRNHIVVRKWDRGVEWVFCGCNEGAHIIRAVVAPVRIRAGTRSFSGWGNRILVFRFTRKE